jgi:aminoglycoside phosphotransferase (APT) family kinase protein
MPESKSASELKRIARTLELVFPDARPVAPLRFVDQGFRSIAVETAGGVLMRVGTSVEAAAGYELETRALPFIAKQVDAAVPAPQWYTKPNRDLPFGALGYPKLPGSNPKWGVEPPRRFALSLGRFMAQLHSAPVDQAIDSGISEVNSFERLISAEDIVMPALRRRLSAPEFVHLLAWWEEFRSDDRMQLYELSVCHHDLWHGNLLIGKSGELAGVLDWAHVEVGDRAHDFAATRYFGEQFNRQLIDAYLENGGSFGVEDQYRAQKFWEGREFGGIAWAIENSDENELEEGIGKLRRGPLFQK